MKRKWVECEWTANEGRKRKTYKNKLEKNKNEMITQKLCKEQEMCKWQSDTLLGF